MKNHLLLAAIVVMLCGCEAPIGEKIQQRWVFTELETPYSEALGKAISQEAYEATKLDMKQLVRGNRLVLADSGRAFGVLMGEYVLGNWKFNSFSNELVTRLQYPKNLKLRWLVKESKGKKLTLQIIPTQLQKVRTGHADSTQLELEDALADKQYWSITAEKEDAEFDAENPDPWSPALNAWRAKPTAPENTKQLEARMRNHLEFMYSFFAFASNPERYWVSQDWFFSAIKPGSNGIGIYSPKRVPAQWQAVFYDSAQAAQGYAILRKVFDADIKVPEADNGVEMNKKLLRMLLTEFDRLYGTGPKKD
ncbi:MAG: hypothetical protein EAY75_08905 [Bacteroidetes bacterium]|nr:MAG: hypothetical protein EAY75_08905 [Bacteroidota bacterium]